MERFSKNWDASNYVCGYVNSFVELGISIIHNKIKMYLV